MTSLIVVNIQNKHFLNWNYLLASVVLGITCLYPNAMAMGWLMVRYILDIHEII